MPTLRRSAKSLLLLGPRQTGKSTLVAQLELDLTINLFHEPSVVVVCDDAKDTYRTKAVSPSRRAARFNPPSKHPKASPSSGPRRSVAAARWMASNPRNA